MDNVRKKQTKYLLILLASGLITLTSVILLIVFLNDVLISTILLFTTLIPLVLLMAISSKYEVVTNQYKLLRLQSSKVNLLPTKSIKSDDFMNILRNKNYSLYYDQNDLSLYHLLSSGLSLKKKDLTLYSFVFIKDYNKSFLDKSINIRLEHLEKEIYKKPTYSRRIFYLVKEIDNLTPKDVKAANQVLFISSKRMDVVLINVYLIKNTNEVYFLHDDKYAPSLYYKHAVEYLKNLI